MAFSRIDEMAKAIAVTDGLIAGFDMWDDLSRDMRDRYRRFARAAIEDLRNPTTAQIARVLRRYPKVPKAAIRQVWKDMIDELRESR